MHIVPAFAASVILLLLQHSSAIHEDQLGRFDWYHQYLGGFSHAYFSSSRPRLAVSSLKNSLAVLNLRSGEIEWRQVYGDADGLQKVLMTEKPAAVFTISGSSGRQILRAWNQHSGALVWDLPLCGQEAVEADSAESTAISSLGPDQTSTLDRSFVFAAACGELQAVNSSSAEVAWVHALPTGSASVELVADPASATVTALSVYTRGPDSWVDAAVLSAAEGKLVRSVSLRLPHGQAGGVSGRKATTAGSRVVALSEGGDLCVADIAEGSEFSCAPLPPELRGTRAAALAEPQPGGAVLLRGAGPDGGLALLTLAGDGSPSKAQPLRGFSAACSMPSESGQAALAVVGSNETSVWWAVVDATTGERLHEEVVGDLRRWGRRAAADAGGGAAALDRCFLGSFARKDGRTGWRLVAAASDGSAALLQQGEVVWVREEALAGVRSSLAVDFPSLRGGLEGHAGLTPLQHLRKQILTLKTQMGAASASEASELAELRLQGSDVMLSTPDTSGFRKLLVVLSDAAKVLGLHNGDGHVMWGLSFNASCPPQYLGLWQQPHGLTTAPQVVVVRANTPGCQSLISIIDAHQGKEIHSQPADISVAQILSLPTSYRSGKSDQSTMLLVSSSQVDSGPVAQLVPSTAEAAEALVPSIARTVIWELNRYPAPSLKGFALRPSADGNATLFQSYEIWSISFGENSKIETVVSRDSSTVHSRIKVLGDRNMLVKYLNPNTLFIATSETRDQGNDEDHELQVHVVDTVSGRHLFRQVHRGAAGPVVAAFCENWIVYHYWDILHMRFELAVIELYDDTSARGLSLADAVFANTTVQATSLVPVSVKTHRQVFFFNPGVRFITVTKTSRGITARQLLIGTTGDQVYALDKRLVDPRRPLGTPSQADREERLLQYKPDLGLNPVSFATYDKFVAGLRGADTFPTALESTTLMLAYGMDLFYTRLAPSKSFDMLDDDFSYALLVVTLLGMAGLGLYLQVTKQRKELAKKWA